MSKQQQQESVTTKERLLFAAEKLVAEKGFRGVSLRDITNEAQANVAAVNYYFSSKEALADEVISRHIGPVNEARLVALKQLREQHKGESIAVRELLFAFLRPMVERMLQCSLRNDLFGKIMGRCMGDKGQALPSQVEPQMKQVIGAFIEELTRSLPQLRPETVLWRLHFSFGVVAHTLLFSDRLSEFAGLPKEGVTVDSSLQRMVDYCEAGLMASDRDGSVPAVETKGGQNEFNF